MRASAPQVFVFRYGDGPVEGVDLTPNAAMQDLLDDDLDRDDRGRPGAVHIARPRIS